MAALYLLSLVLMLTCVCGTPVNKRKDENQDVSQRLFGLLTNMYVRKFHKTQSADYKRYISRVYTFIKSTENQENRQYDLRSTSKCKGDDCNDVSDDTENELLSTQINTEKGAEQANTPDEKKKEAAFNHDVHKKAPPKTDSSGKRNFSPASNLWTSGIVPYLYKDMDENQKQWVEKAIEIFHKETCLFFRVKQKEDLNYITFDGKTDVACQSGVGMTGGEQTINLPTPACSSLGTALHEIMHSLGQQHEQSRYDRSHYLKIDWSNLSPGMGPDFLKEKITKVENDHYDVYSAMQYMLDSGAKDDSKPSMILKNSKLNYLASLTKTISHTDKLEINTAYKCTDKCSEISCENTGFPFWTHDDKSCRCKCPQGFIGDHCEQIKSPCHGEGIVELELNKEKTIEPPQDKNGRYERKQHCRILVKGPPNSRVKAIVTKLGLDYVDFGALKQCVHFVRFSFDLISQPGKVECGIVPNAESNTLTFLKTESSESNMMLITFNSMKSAPEEAFTYDGPGFTVKLIAYKSGCVPNRCRLPAICEDSEDTTTSVCKCKAGYSGDLCDYVKLSDTVKCNVDGDLNGDCFFRNDESIKDSRFAEVRSAKGKLDVNQKETVVRSTDGSGLFATIEAYDYGKTVRLITDVKFEVGERCLSFQYYIASHKFEEEDGEPEGDRSKFSVWYSGTNMKKTKLFERDESTDDLWELVMLRIPGGIENLKIVIEGQYESADIGNGIDNIVLQKTCTGPCYPSPCQNSGRCYQSGSSLKCHCRKGFVGQHCETDLCHPNPCKNGGKCKLNKDDPDKYKCTCQEGYKGDRCEIEICANDTCKNGGSCTVLGEDFECNCDIEYKGKTCEDKVCKPDSCKNGGKCVVTEFGTVHCECKAGYTGNKCEKEVCKPNPCQHGGTCKAPGDYYECSCPSGYFGETCQNDVCIPNRCQNGAVCKHDHGQYPNCVCTDYFAGPLCEHKTKLCGGIDRTYQGDKFCKDFSYCTSDQDCKLCDKTSKTCTNSGAKCTLNYDCYTNRRRRSLSRLNKNLRILPE